ncbi:RNA-binding protein 1-like [Dorcoceras hygrometricum]|uniref:RNA-binding protein 1-like n=1 Tax=Dorcoceras hygrometricum TaxID=472368 RepID=A0A2Z7BAC9_9LAMI|nr:RNA-binding protein 1-like [Dorcoceras hygrometricum]
MDDPEQNKIFIGGISWETTDEILKQHFGKYGTILASVIAKDRISGSPRGFAFVTFSDSSAFHRVLQDSHEILGRTVDVKKAITKSEQQSDHQHDKTLSRTNIRSNTRSSNHIRTKKIFVGGLSANLTEEDFRSYFEKFGRITDVVVMHDNLTHRPRGFGFITFDSEDSVDEAVHKNFHQLGGKLVEVKRAVPKDGNSGNSSGFNGRIGSGRGQTDNSYSRGNYLLNDTRFGYSPSGYGNVPGYVYGGGMFGGGYPPGGYGGISYGFPPIAPGRPWNHAMIGVRNSLLPYGSGPPIYPMHLNGWTGVTSLAGNGYNGFLDTGSTLKSAQFSDWDPRGTDESMSSHAVENNVHGSYSFSSGRGLGAAAM